MRLPGSRSSGGSGLFLTRSAREVLDGAGLLSVGEELIQYREAHLTAPGVVRLTGLLRGRFGTPVGEVSAGTLVMALPRTGGAPFQTEPDALGREIAFLVSGAGDPPGGALLTHRVSGSGWAPLAPVHVRAQRLTDGTLVCSWVERHRNNWRWESAEPTPAGSYRLHVRTDGGVTRTVGADVTGLRLEPARQIEMFGFLLGTGEVRVEAVGDGPEALRFSAWVTI